MQILVNILLSGIIAVILMAAAVSHHYPVLGLIVSGVFLAVLPAFNAWKPSRRFALFTISLLVTGIVVLIAITVLAILTSL